MPSNKVGVKVYLKVNPKPTVPPTVIPDLPVKKESGLASLIPVGVILLLISLLSFWGLTRAQDESQERSKLVVNPTVKTSAPPAPNVSKFLETPVSTAAQTPKAVVQQPTVTPTPTQTPRKIISYGQEGTSKLRGWSNWDDWFFYADKDDVIKIEFFTREKNVVAPAFYLFDPSGKEVIRSVDCKTPGNYHAKDLIDLKVAGWYYIRAIYNCALSDYTNAQVYLSTDGFYWLKLTATNR